MFLVRVDETLIAAHGRWRSLEYRKYLDFIKRDAVAADRPACCPRPHPLAVRRGCRARLTARQRP